MVWDGFGVVFGGWFSALFLLSGSMPPLNGLGSLQVGVSFMALASKLLAFFVKC
jgi:hypothetical protein